MKKRVISILLMLVLVLTIGLPTANAIDQSIVLLEKNPISDGVKQSGIANTYFKVVQTAAGNVPGYCLNMGWKSPDKGATLTAPYDVTSAPLLYIFEHGYHNGGYDSALLGSLTNEQAYYATQLAIWLYQHKDFPDILNPNMLSDSNTAAKAAKTLYSASLGAGYVPKGNYYTVLAPDYNISLNDAKTEYSSKYLWIDGTGNFDTNLYVTADNGFTDFKLVKDDGTEFKSGDKISKGTNSTNRFKIVVPADKVTKDVKFTVQWKVTWNFTSIYSYAGPVANTQTIGVAIPDNIVKDGKAELKLKYTTQPTCDTDLAAILNATSEDKRTYDNKEYMDALSGLKAKYPEADIQNIKKPSCTPLNHSCEADLDAILSATPAEKRTSDNGSYLVALRDLKAKYPEADIEDIVNPTCTPKTPYVKKLTVHKQDASTKVELAGATLAIKDANGNIVKQWISTTEPYVITDLAAGKYTLVELESPVGYELGDGVIEFELVGDEYDSEITMYNSKIPDTADINFALIVTAFIVFLGFGIFGLVQASKREA